MWASGNLLPPGSRLGGLRQVALSTGPHVVLLIVVLPSDCAEGLGRLAMTGHVVIVVVIKYWIPGNRRHVQARRMAVLRIARGVLVLDESASVAGGGAFGAESTRRRGPAPPRLRRSGVVGGT